jgi:hypothetical protein
MDLYTQMDTSSIGEEPYLDYSADKYKEALDFLIKCSLTQYLPVLVAEGFETMNAVSKKRNGKTFLLSCNCCKKMTYLANK